MKSNSTQKEKGTLKVPNSNSVKNQAQFIKNFVSSINIFHFIRKYKFQRNLIEDIKKLDPTYTKSKYRIGSIIKNNIKEISSNLTNNKP